MHTVYVLNDHSQLDRSLLEALANPVHANSKIFPLGAAQWSLQHVVWWGSAKIELHKQSLLSTTLCCSRYSTSWP